MTADEFLWVDRSRNFLAGLLNPAYRCTTPVEAWTYAEGLACTLRTGHPGVTTMWTGSLGFWLSWLAAGRPRSLYEFVVAASTNPLDASLIAPERAGTVFITALWVVAVYWLARRLFGGAVALVGAVLIALDPFHIALSRVIHHDALSTTFMTLSALAALIYWGEAASRRWLVASGLLAGLGFVSKSPAMFLMPFVAVAGLCFFVTRWRRGEFWDGDVSAGRDFVRLVLDGLLWFACALAAAVLIWPALWVVPREAIETVFFIGSKYATGGHAKGNFFLGTVSRDPGVLFYPVTWLFRASPPALVGVVLGLGRWRRRQTADDERGTTNFAPLDAPGAGGERPVSMSRYLPVILIYILGYYLLMTIGEKKQDRYFLPVYPWLNFIAAYGLMSILNFEFSILNFRFLNHKPQKGVFRILGVWTHLGGIRGDSPRSPLSVLKFWTDPPQNGASAPRKPYLLLLVTILCVNGYLTAVNYPYYFTYYNPLLGGIRAAARVVTIGWGEGLDQAAAYLNQRYGPDYPRVASWYQSTFAPFYRGTAISYSKEKGKALAGDYTVFYINQVQRRFPDDALFDYFEQRFEPVKVISLKGQPYAWIYPSLGVDHYVEDQTYTGIASLLAWQWVGGDRPLTPGTPAQFELWWEYLGKLPEEPFFVRLVDAQDRRWAEARTAPVPEQNPPPTAWKEGDILMERGSLTPPFDLPPGDYRLQIGFYTQAPAVKEGELRFTLPEADAQVRVDHQPRNTVYTPPPEAALVGQPLGNALTLLAATWPDTPQKPGSVVSLDFYWQVNRPIPADYRLHAGLVDENGDVQQAWFDLTLAELLAPASTTWQAGDILHTRWRLDLQPDLPPGPYRLDLVLAEDIEQTLLVGQVVVRP